MDVIELYSSKKWCQDSCGNIFTENYILINDVSSLQNNNDYSFLKKIRSNKKAYFVYCVCNTENNTIKLGKSDRPFQRTMEHVSNFVSYSGARQDSIYIICSRYTFHEDSNIEKELLNEFRSQNLGAAQIAREFFAPVSPNVAENFFCDFINKINYKKYE